MRMKCELMSPFLRYLVELAHQPALVRNVAIVGHLHHGKTTFVGE